jgi:hypothetical protein
VTKGRFFGIHWGWWLLGALAGAATQVVWLQSHGWGQALLRLSFGIALGGLILVPILSLVIRYSVNLRKIVRRNAAYLLGLDRKQGRRAWALALAMAIAAGSAATYFWWMRPIMGAQKVREYFLAHAEKDVKGMLTLHYPDLARVKPKEVSLTSNQLAFPSAADFPGDKERHFVLRWLGVIEAPESGTYGFGGKVDDGLIILIDGKIIANDWREAPPRDVWGTVALAKGWHALDIRYRQVAGGAMLHVFWQPPGANRKLLPPAIVRPLRPDTHLAEITRLRLAYDMLPWPGSTYPPFLGGRFWRMPWYSLQL